jgi:hypothetical protein
MKRIKKSITSLIMLLSVTVFTLCTKVYRAANADSDAEQIGAKISALIGTLYKISFIVLGAVGVGFGIFIFIMFALAGGDEQRMKKAKDTTKNILIGVVLLAIISAIWPLVISWLISYTGE